MNPENPPTFDETVTKAAKAVYARTKTGGTIRWELLPRDVQEEIESVARTAITVALIDLHLAVSANAPKGD